MTEENKQLLLKDICARLPYHDLWVQYYNKDWLAIGYGHERIELLSSIVSSVTGPCPLIDEIKPYLRPMSSMTQEEKEFIYNGHIEFWVREDYCNKHHLDYRGLIPKELALKAPEGMYKID